MRGSEILASFAFTFEFIFRRDTDKYTLWLMGPYFEESNLKLYFFTYSILPTITDITLPLHDLQPFRVYHERYLGEQLYTDETDYKFTYLYYETWVNVIVKHKKYNWVPFEIIT